MAEYWIKQGDTAPRIESTLTDGANTPVDIAQADIFFTLRRIDDDGTPIVNKIAASNDQITDGEDGSRGFVHYDWTIGDTDIAGGYRAEWEVLFVNNLVMTFPNNGYDLIAIIEQLEGPPPYLQAIEVTVTGTADMTREVVSP